MKIPAYFHAFTLLLYSIMAKDQFSASRRRWLKNGTFLLVRVRPIIANVHRIRLESYGLQYFLQ
ncbi:MAG: hypothetical protein AAFR61_32560, partial [Bacteroidota bacterium]